MEKRGGPASRGETGHRRLGARVRYTNLMLPTLRTHGIIAHARVGKYLLIIRCGLLRSSCVSYGEAFTRACAQIPPRPRNADIAAGKRAQRHLQYVARASHALMMQMLINSTPRIAPVSAALHCFAVLTTQSEIVPITADASSNEQRANAQEQQEHPEAQPKQSPTSGVTQHHRLPCKAFSTCRRCARSCSCSSRK